MLPTAGQLSFAVQGSARVPRRGVHPLSLVANYVPVRLFAWVAAQQRQTRLTLLHALAPTLRSHCLTTVTVLGPRAPCDGPARFRDLEASGDRKRAGDPWRAYGFTPPVRVPL